jgi:hypothetical protein
VIKEGNLPYCSRRRELIFSVSFSFVNALMAKTLFRDLLPEWIWTADFGMPKDLARKRQSTLLDFGDCKDGRSYREQVVFNLESIESLKSSGLYQAYFNFS